MPVLNPSLIRDQMKHNVDRLKSRSAHWYKTKPESFGYTTGLSTLDKITGGLVMGELIVLAGGTGMGKTSLAMQLVEHSARSIKKSGEDFVNLVFSAEMSMAMLYLRMAAKNAGLDTGSIRLGLISSAQLERLHMELDDLLTLPMLIIDVPKQESKDVLAGCEAISKEAPIGVCVVDYIQRLADEGDNVNVRVANIMRNLGIAKSNAECCMLALSQYSRLKERERRKPILSDLRDSGAIEQDADQVWALHLPTPDARLSGVAHVDVELHVLKNRNGRMGVSFLDMEMTSTSFKEMSPPSHGIV